MSADKLYWIQGEHAFITEVFADGMEIKRHSNGSRVATFVRAGVVVARVTTRGKLQHGEEGSPVQDWPGARAD